MGSAAALGLKWSVALRLGRVSNLATIWTDVLAGLVLSKAAWGARQLGLLVVAMSLFYVGGMFLNDALDRDFDRINRPGRPIPSGQVGASGVFAAALGMFMFGFVLIFVTVILAGVRPLAPIAATTALVGLIVAYDMWHKSNPFSPVLMALCRAFVYVTAAAAVAPRLPSDVLFGAFVAACYVIGLTYCAKQEHDQSLTRRWPLALLGAPLVYCLPLAAAGGVALIIYLVLAASVARAFWLSSPGAGANAPGAVALLIAAISLVDALLIVGQGQTTLGALAACAVVITLVSQYFIAGT